MSDSTSRVLVNCSVVIPAYNAEKFIDSAIQSVLEQTYTDYELIVVDDGSTDRTPLIVRKYENSVRCVQQENKGLSAARNTGIEHAMGKWVAFLDADDGWHPEKLAKQFALVDRNESIGFCSTEALLVDGDGETIGEWGAPKLDGTLLRSIFRWNSSIPGSGSGVLVKKELFRVAGRFDTRLSSLEDIDMWMRLAATTEYACVPEALTFVQRSGNSMSTNYSNMRKNAIEVMKKNRRLLAKKDQGIYWRFCLAGVYADYAKWAYRSGYKLRAILDLLHALVLSPARSGRMVLGLLFAMIRRRSL